ncbi:hypothetical protein ABZW03_16280 [Kitasatospora sp. NPDC004799]|uniref:hypothetical protein n=1 Tax=Kitasatospora sp. NPDC004799 TaxID=3154460 RepID=UPI0033AD1B72
MTPLPARLGPSSTKDTLLSAALLPVLAAIPAAAYVLFIVLALSLVAMDDGEVAEVVVVLSGLIGVITSLGVPGYVAFRARQAGYRFLPVAAALAPFLVPGWAVAGFPGA